MAKGYWLVHVDAAAPGSLKDYLKQVGPFLDANGGHYLVRAGEQVVTEGDVRVQTVVIEFESFAHAKAVYDSAEYQALKALRIAAIDGDFAIVEGVA